MSQWFHKSLESSGRKEILTTSYHFIDLRGVSVLKMEVKEGIIKWINDRHKDTFKFQNKFENIWEQKNDKKYKVFNQVSLLFHSK